MAEESVTTQNKDNHGKTPERKMSPKLKEASGNDWQPRRLGNTDIWAPDETLVVSTEAGTLQMFKNTHQRKGGGREAGTGRGRERGGKRGGRGGLGLFVQWWRDKWAVQAQVMKSPESVDENVSLAVGTFITFWLAHTAFFVASLLDWESSENMVFSLFFSIASVSLA